MFTGMERFLSRLDIQHVKSSPYYPQSNGMVERLHWLIRERLQGLRSTIPFSQRLQQILIDIRSSRHRMLGATPSKALFNRVLRTTNSYSICDCKPRIPGESQSSNGKVSRCKETSTAAVIANIGHCGDSPRWLY